MVKVEVTEDFTLQKFDEIKNLTRKGKDEKGSLFLGDTFECDEKMADYLTGNNPLNKVVVKVIEVIPKEVKPKEEKPKAAKTTKKKK